MCEYAIVMLMFLTNELIDALHHFYVFNQYHLFDPHVGDTACQIRAYYLLQLKNTLDKKDLQIRLDSLLNIQNQLLEAKKNLASYVSSGACTLAQFVKKINGYYPITADEWLLFRFYILTICKKAIDVNITVIDYEFIADKSNLSRDFAKKLVHYYQGSLAKSSCDIVVEWNKGIDLKNQYPNDLRELCRLDDNGRPVLPCYVHSKIIYEHLILSTQYVVVQVVRKQESSQKTLYFLVNTATDTAVMITEKMMAKLNVQGVYLVVKGESIAFFPETEEMFLDRFNSVGFKNIYLTNMAAHPQYTGDNLIEYRQDPFRNFDLTANSGYFSMSHEISTMRQLASKIGCCQADRSLFFMMHVYCSQLSNLIHVEPISTKPAYVMDVEKLRQLA